MKTILKLSIFLLSAFTLASCATNRSIAGSAVADQPGPHVSFHIFYESLRPYGRWINYSNYGQAWIPNAGRGFRPYATNGHWVYSTYGWTWVSNYRWGWAPFHYGRWTFDNYYGWIWIPGEVWAPAWVAWRNSSNYYGWAPLGPGMRINVNMGIPASRWVFIPRRYITNRHVYRYFRPRQQNVVIIRNTTIINNYGQHDNRRYSAGPTRRAVQQATNQNVRPVRVMSSNKPEETRLDNNRLRIYRPTLEKSSDNNRRAVENSSGDRRPQRVIRSSGDKNSTAEKNESDRKARPVRTKTPDNTPVRRQAAPKKQETRSRRPARQTRPEKESHSRSSNRQSVRPSSRPAPNDRAPVQKEARQSSRSSRPQRR